MKTELRDAIEHAETYLTYLFYTIGSVLRCVSQTAEPNIKRVAQNFIQRLAARDNGYIPIGIGYSPKGAMVGIVAELLLLTRSLDQRCYSE